MNSRNKGFDGEERAAAYLESQGFKIIARNFRVPGGEIDIIAQHDDTLVFIEVKAWTSFGIENLEYAINNQKQARIIKTAKFFLATHREYNSMALRFDVLFIGKQGIHHLASAFMERVL
ncbi:MAG: YraN family protein [Treponema sp.]|nr:YraN family protein [Treponema sp.]